MNDRNSARKQKNAFLQALRIIFMFETLSVISAKPGVIHDVTANETVAKTPNSTTISNCGGSYWVGTTAQVFSIPHTNSTTPRFCQWLLKAKDSQHSIALSSLDMMLDFSEPDVRFRLEARDGWSADSPLMSVLEHSPEEFFKPRDFDFGFPMIATSGFMLLQYWSSGHNPLLIDLAYYTCGGQTDSFAHISSPIFEGLSVLPSMVKCEWRLKKPEKALYGYLDPVFTNVNDCCTLRMSSNSTMRVIEPSAVNTTQDKYVSLTANQVYNSTFGQNLTTTPTDKNFESCSTPVSGSYVVPICGDSIKLIAFDSDIAVLKYVSTNPNKELGFRAFYATFKVPGKLDISSNKVAWYLDYCLLIFFTPIGVFIGAIIIMYQTRRRGPARDRPAWMTKFMSSFSTDTCRIRASSVQNETTRSEDFVKPPAKRARSLTNIKIFATIAERHQSGKRRNNNNGFHGEEKTTEHIEKKKLLSRNESSSSNATATEMVIQEIDETSLRASGCEVGGDVCGQQRLTRSTKSVECHCDEDIKKLRAMKKLKVRFSTMELLSDGAQTL